MIPILTGPTASGKTAIALEFATSPRFQGKIEIINADSMLVYRGMDVGTAKPTATELASVPHHLIDVRNPDEPFTAGEFYRETMKAIDLIQARGKKPLIVGGTGFYLKALLMGLWEAPPADPALRKTLEALPSEELRARLAEKDSDAATRIGNRDRYRLVRALEIIALCGKTPTELEKESTSRKPDPRFSLFWVDRPDPELAQRIHSRTDAMLKAGFVSEVESLLKTFPDSRALSAVGYAQTSDFLKGVRPSGRRLRPGLVGLADEIELATRQLVKRQRTWFKGQAQELSQTQAFTLELDHAKVLDHLARALD